MSECMLELQKRNKNAPRYSALQRTIEDCAMVVLCWNSISAVAC